MTPGSDLPRGSWKTKTIPDPSLSDPDRNRITRLLRAETDTSSDELRCLGRTDWPERFAFPRLIQPDHRTNFNPVTLNEDLFWPVGGPQRAEKPQTSCPGCGSRKLTPTGSCAHCGTQITHRPIERKVYYVGVADMSTEEAATTVRAYGRWMNGKTLQENLDHMACLSTPTRGQWMTR